MQQATPVPALTTTVRRRFAPACPASSADPADGPNPICRSSVSLRMKAAVASVTAAIAATLAAVAALLVLPAAPAGSAQRPAKPEASITRSAHVAFENCNAQHITLSVTAPRHAFAPTQPVTLTVRLRNNGNTACGGPIAQQVPEAHHALIVGPCGPLALTVRSPNGRTVYPGPVVFHCPEETGFQLAPHTSVQATAEWNEAADVGTATAGAEPQQAPPGTYRLTVDATVTVPVTLTSI
jgi:hypothetical protein